MSPTKDLEQKGQNLGTTLTEFKNKKAVPFIKAQLCSQVIQNSILK